MELTGDSGRHVEGEEFENEVMERGCRYPVKKYYIR